MKSMFYYNDAIDVLKIYETTMSSDEKENTRKETIRIGSEKTHADEFAELLNAQMAEN